MPRAFLFMKLDAGSENEILQRLRFIPEVMEAYFVYGAYDMVARIDADSKASLKKLVSSKIKSDKVRSILVELVKEPKAPT